MVTGIAAGVALAGGLAGALNVPVGGTVPGNVLSAGYLTLHVDSGPDEAQTVTNLVPGESRSVDQLISADMAGVGAADLSVTLTDPSGDAFAEQTRVDIAVSSPEPKSTIGWRTGTPTPDTCSPADGYHTPLTVGTLASLDATVPLGTFTADDNALCIRYTLTLADTAGNEAQGATGDFTMRYTLQQTAAVTP